MVEENDFLKKLTELKDLGFLQGGMVTKEQIEEAFPSFSEEQQALLEDYLKKNRIGIDEAMDPSENLSEEENGYLQFYLEELENLEEASEDLKRVYVMNALNGDQVAKKKLTECYLKNVVDIAKLYTGQGAMVADLIGEGNVALAIAVDMIDCIETPEDADSMIVKMIMNAMEEYVGIEGEESKKEEKALSTVVKVVDQAKEMSEELLRKVTVEELSKESGISQKKIREAMQITKSCYDYIEGDSSEDNSEEDN